MPPELAVGFVLLAACPGGATTNLITHLAKGDVALSITLTAIASMITVLTIPILVDLGLLAFMGESQTIKLPILENARQVSIEFEGTDMNMGLFRQALSPLPAGGFAANVTLPVCATGAMRWHARLSVRTKTETLVAPFDLTTGSLSPVRS
jgi:predicted Na+-dependent transporter